MYKIINEQSILRTSDNAIIPIDENNSDYTQYLLWLSLGNTPEHTNSMQLTEVTEI